MMDLFVKRITVVNLGERFDSGLLLDFVGDYERFDSFSTVLYRGHYGLQNFFRSWDGL